MTKHGNIYQYATVSGYQLLCERVKENDFGYTLKNIFSLMITTQWDEEMSPEDEFASNTFYLESRDLGIIINEYMIGQEHGAEYHIERNQIITGGLASEELQQIYIEKMARDYIMQRRDQLRPLINDAREELQVAVNLKPHDSDGNDILSANVFKFNKKPH